MQGKTFISYTRFDKAFACRLYADLRSAGINVWLDEYDIKPGERWAEKVQAALTESTEVIVILSPESVASRSVLDEVSYALDRKRVVPVLLRDCDIPYRIAPLHYTDFQADYASALKHLVSTLSFPIAGTTNQELPDDKEDPLPLIPRPPKSVGTTARSKILYGLGIVGVIGTLALAARIYWVSPRATVVLPEKACYDSPIFSDCKGVALCQEKKARASLLLAVKDWRAQLADSPLLNDCMCYQPCIERKAVAAKLLPVKDWLTQPADSPLLNDCMSYPPCVERKAYAAKLRSVKDWKTQLIDSPLLNDCMSYPPCVERKAYANTLLSVKDWKTQLIDSPLLSDCMSHPPCVERKAYADTLRSVKDWKKQLIDSPLLNDCMSYPLCVERRDHADKLRLVKDWHGLPLDSALLRDCMGYERCLAAAAARKTSSSPRPQVKNYSATEWDDCCDDMGKLAAACRAWKVKQRVRDHCVHK